MTHTTEYEHQNNGSGFFAGVLIGGLVGAAVGLFLAPYSGKETVSLLRNKSLELKDQAEQAAREARYRAEAVAQDVRFKAERLVDDTRAKVQEKKAQIERTAEAAKEAWREGEHETELLA